jgi:hypothetical protein
MTDNQLIKKGFDSFHVSANTTPFAIIMALPGSSSSLFGLYQRSWRQGRVLFQSG